MPPQATGQPMAILTLKFPASPAWEGRIAQDSYTLGRAADNNGVLPVDGTSGVSSRHLVISRDQAGWHVTDVSRNGTSVNGQRIPPNQRVPLPNGATLALGPAVKVEFRSLS
jgi:pSer/pThr/pTyr-binding forkhead associated (FHA) protein